jgi:excisionase family DNA binding protein
MYLLYDSNQNSLSKRNLNLKNQALLYIIVNGKGGKMMKKVTKKPEKRKLIVIPKTIDPGAGEVQDNYPPEVLTIAELAKLLRVTPRAIYHLVRDKKIPALKVGTKFRFYRKAVLDAMSKIPE